MQLRETSSVHINEKAKTQNAMEKVSSLAKEL